MDQTVYNLCFVPHLQGNFLLCAFAVLFYRLPNRRRDRMSACVRACASVNETQRYYSKSKIYLFLIRNGNRMCVTYFSLFHELTHTLTFALLYYCYKFALFSVLLLCLQYFFSPWIFPACPFHRKNKITLKLHVRCVFVSVLCTLYIDVKWFILVFFSLVSKTTK